MGLLPKFRLQILHLFLRLPCILKVPVLASGLYVHGPRYLQDLVDEEVFRIKTVARNTLERLLEGGMTPRLLEMLRQFVYLGFVKFQCSLHSGMGSCVVDNWPFHFHLQYWNTKSWGTTEVHCSAMLRDGITV